MNLIELHLKLPESRKLDVELLAHFAKLILNQCEHIFSTRHRACRPAVAPCPAVPGRAARARCAVFAPVTALASFAFRPSRVCRHGARF